MTVERRGEDGGGRRRCARATAAPSAPPIACRSSTSFPNPGAKRSICASIAGRTFGFRVREGGSTFTYISDHGPVALGPGPEGFGPYHEAARELCAGSELLIHDAQHTAEEFPDLKGFGHSAIDYAVGLARECGIPRVLLFHHDPRRTDGDLDALVAALQQDGLLVEAAAEGVVIELPSTRP